MNISKAGSLLEFFRKKEFLPGGIRNNDYSQVSHPHNMKNYIEPLGHHLVKGNKKESRFYWEETTGTHAAGLHPQEVIHQLDIHLADKYGKKVHERKKLLSPLVQYNSDHLKGHIDYIHHPDKVYNPEGEYYPIKKET